MELNEHDVTKKMLKTIRLTEANDNDVIDIEGDELSKEVEEFAQIVGDESVVPSLYRIYPKDKNVEFSGTFDSGIEFKFSKRDGAYINASNIKLTLETAEMISRLSKYFERWQGDMGKKLRNEYSQGR